MIFVTGATGLLGSNLLFNLAQHNSHIVALYRNEYSIETVKQVFKIRSTNFDSLFKKIEWRKGDILDIESLKDAMHDALVIYHCAGYVSFIPHDFNMLFNINVKGTQNVVNCALSLPIKHFCHVSSIATLGDVVENEYYTEETDLIYSKHHSLYTKTKFDGEMEVWRAIAEGLPAVIINPSVIFGVGNWNTGSNSIIKTIYKGLRFYPTGATGIVYVDDVCSIMMQLTEKQIVGERFIVNGENISYKNLFDLIAQPLDKKLFSFKATPFLMKILLSFQNFRYYTIGIKPTISASTIKTACKKSYYSNKKIIDTLNYNFSQSYEYFPSLIQQIKIINNNL